MLYDKTSSDSLLGSLKKAVDDTIARLLASVEPSELRQALSQGAFGGKRIRPILAMLSCSAVGGDAFDALQAATAIELLHTSSLVHDDIMDRAEVRRGVPTIHSRYGLSMGILAGDTLIALAFRVMQNSEANNRERIMATFMQAFLHTCEGQGYDLVLSRAPNRSAVSHRLMVEKKTARLLEAAASIGALVATADDEHVRALGRFGFDLGMAFQAKDDLLDQTGDETRLGKPVRADHRNGKMTFVSLAAAGGSAQHMATFVDLEDHVAELTRSACSALDVLPPSSARENLRALAQALLTREN